MNEECREVRLILMNGQAIEMSIKGTNPECEKYIDYMRKMICAGHWIICHGQCEIDVKIEASLMESSLVEINSRQIAGLYVDLCPIARPFPGNS